MVITEFYRTRDDGVNLYRTYSDSNKMLVRNDGVEFSEAIDIEGCEHTYTESEKDIDFGYDPEEATAEDYQKALAEFGVSV